MITLTTLSASGGAGRTSVAILLAQMLKDLGREVLLLQCDPINLMPYQLGMPHTEELGLIQALTGTHALSDCLHNSSEGVRYLPFGGHGQEEHLSLLQQCLQEPERLTHLIQQTCIEEDTILICDLPRWPSAWCDVFLRISDMNLKLLLPDSNSMLGIAPMMPQLLKSRGATYFLMNRFDSSRVLHLDMWTLAKMKLGHRLLPFYLHEDQALPESFAAGLPLREHAPQSLLAEDFQKLSNWIDAEISG